MSSNTVRRGRKFVVSSVSSDAHMWNLVFLQLLLEEHGGEVRNLGACVPDELIIEECRAERPDVLVISTVNGHGHLDGLRLIRKIRQEPDLEGIRVVIGGKLGVRGAENIAFVRELVEGGFDAVFESEGGLQDFQEFLAGLQPAARPALSGVGGHTGVAAAAGASGIAELSSMGAAA
ncbi:cobalamin B12-binding domain-containing protein [Streptomyces sp. NBC_00289]|uniref:cobalamin B12-binding domain-containing protein n=1 Tax=Streptomyces sp. NBC_00289 TaxID=2975703 RepID=UPI00352D5CC6